MAKSLCHEGSSSRLRYLSPCKGEINLAGWRGVIRLMLRRALGLWVVAFLFRDGRKMEWTAIYRCWDIRRNT